MKNSPLIAAACGALLFTCAAQAQYTVPPSTSGKAAWEVDAGVGYVFNSNISTLDNGTNLHLGGYKLQPATATRDTVTKFGGELYYSTIDGDANAKLSTLFLSADIGIAQKLGRSVEVGITGGLGVGRHKFEVGTFDDSSNAFGYQIRPEVIFHVNNQVGVSLAYRFLQTFPLDSNWKDNPTQHALELSVRVAF